VTSAGDQEEGNPKTPRLSPRDDDNRGGRGSSPSRKTFHHDFFRCLPFWVKQEEERVPAAVSLPLSIF